MEFLTVLLFFIILFLIYSINRNISNRFSILESEIRRLTDKLSYPKHKEDPDPVIAPPVAPVSVKEVIKEDKWESGFKPIEEPVIVPAPTMLIAGEEETVTANFESAQPIPVFSAPSPNETYATQQIQEKPGFFERHPDLEKFIGENLVSKIGIAILVLAIGFFVKYAIDNNWIAPVGRVAIGILCGGILAALGHRLRNSYTAFSSVMVGGALAVFYFTISLAYHQFHLFNQSVSFTIMIIITAFAVALSILYNRQELAIIALIGGFATPFMVSNESGNYQALFTYLIILNIGLLIISYNKAWRILNILAFIFTVLIFSIWIFSLPGNTPSTTYRNGLLFATVFYLLFFIIHIAHNIKENKKFIASDFGILLANTCLYFTVGLYFIGEIKADDYRGLFSLAIGSFNLGASFLLFRNQKADKNILYLLIGLTLTFISLTAPIQLHGNHITIFWASETVLLYWLFQRSKISIIRLASAIVWASMIVSLMMDWANVYGADNVKIPVLLNKGFITTLFCAIANYALFLVKRRDDIIEEHSILAIVQNKNVLRVISIVLLFLAGVFEINFQFSSLYPSLKINTLYLLLYIFSFVLILIFITNKIPSLQLTSIFKIVLLSFSLIIYLAFTAHYFFLQKQLIQQTSHLHFIAHWLAAILIAIMFYQLIQTLRFNNLIFTKNTAIYTWAICSALVVYLSVEVHLIVNEFFFSKYYSLDNISRVFQKTGLPILWGVCSFAFMWYGMKNKIKLLRIISLTLFSITLLKLFLFDIRNIPAAGKIAAFFCLGVILLVVSFMYQRLKKIIIEDENNVGQ